MADHGDVPHRDIHRAETLADLTGYLRESEAATGPRLIEIPER
ncbi:MULTISPECIES: hypothetical protein [unclassified Streptomyces]